MSENPTNRDRSRHVDVKVHYLRDLVRDGDVKLEREGNRAVNSSRLAGAQRVCLALFAAIKARSTCIHLPSLSLLSPISVTWFAMVM